MASQHSESDKIIHYLSIQQCKRAFYSDAYGVALCAEPIANYEEYDLQPLLAIGLLHQDLPLAWIKYCAKAAPQSVTKILSSAWSQELANPYGTTITGKPDELVIDRRLDNVMTKGFYQWLEREQIAYRFSIGSDRKFTAKCRKLQEYPNVYLKEGLYELADEELLFPEAEKYQLTIPLLNESLIGLSDINYDVDKKTRENLARLYITERPKGSFNEKPIDLDFDSFSADLKIITNNSNNNVSSLGWRSASAGSAQDKPVEYYHCHHGYLVTNYVEKSEEEAFYDQALELEPIYEDFAEEFEALRLALMCSYQKFPKSMTLGNESISRNEIELAINAVVNKNFSELTHELVDYLRIVIGLKEVECPGTLKPQELKSFRLHMHYGYSFHVNKLSRREFRLLWERIQPGSDDYYEIVPETASAIDPAFRIVFKGSMFSRSAFYFSRACDAALALNRQDYGSRTTLQVSDKQYQQILRALSLGRLDLATDLIHELEWDA